MIIAKRPRRYATLKPATSELLAHVMACRYMQPGELIHLLGCMQNIVCVFVGGSAITPASAARNCAVDRRIAEPIGVTDVRVQ